MTLQTSETTPVNSAQTLSTRTSLQDIPVQTYLAPTQAINRATARSPIRDVMQGGHTFITSSQSSTNVNLPATYA